MPKISRPVAYSLLGLVAVTAWIMTGDQPAKTASTKKPMKKISSKLADGGFTEEDLNAHFEPVTAPSKNSFRPLVTKIKTGLDAGIAPDAVPAELADGDPNWVYTGTAEIDGRPTALLENRSTLESDFVSQGEKWKKAGVAQILPQGLILTSPSGKKYRLTLNNGEASIGINSQRYASGFQPVNPPLQGPIGDAAINVRPDRSGSRQNGVEARDAN